MKTNKKLGIAAGVGATILGLFGGTADAGKTELLHYAESYRIGKESVFLFDDRPDGPYLANIGDGRLIAYTKTLGGYKLGVKGIDPGEYSQVPINLETEDVNHVERFIRIDAFNTAGYESRNLLVFQDPNDTQADAGIYDVMDLTSGGTGTGYIPLPTVRNCA